MSIHYKENEDGVIEGDNRGIDFIFGSRGDDVVNGQGGVANVAWLGKGDDVAIIDYANRETYHYYNAGERHEEEVAEESIVEASAAGQDEDKVAVLKMLLTVNDDEQASGDTLVLRFGSNEEYQQYLLMYNPEEAFALLKEQLANGEKVDIENTLGFNADIKNFENIAIMVMEDPGPTVEPVDDLGIVSPIPETKLAFILPQADLLANDVGENLSISAIQIFNDRTDQYEEFDYDGNFNQLISTTTQSGIEVDWNISAAPNGDLVFSRVGLLADIPEGDGADLQFRYRVVDGNGVESMMVATVAIPILGVDESTFPQFQATTLVLAQDAVAAATDGSTIVASGFIFAEDDSGGLEADDYSIVPLAYDHEYTLFGDEAVFMSIGIDGALKQKAETGFSVGEGIVVTATDPEGNATDVIIDIAFLRVESDGALPTAVEGSGLSHEVNILDNDATAEEAAIITEATFVFTDGSTQQLTITPASGALVNNELDGVNLTLTEDGVLIWSAEQGFFSPGSPQEIGHIEYTIGIPDLSSTAEDSGIAGTINVQGVTGMAPTADPSLTVISNVNELEEGDVVLSASQLDMLFSDPDSHLFSYELSVKGGDLDLMAIDLMTGEEAGDSIALTDEIPDLVMETPFDLGETISIDLIITDEDGQSAILDLRLDGFAPPF